jgi:hypothetical protein
MGKPALKVDPLALRRGYCEELLRLRKTHAPAFAREKELKALLLADATENFQETVSGLGKIGVSAPKDASCTGSAPELVVDVFLGMTDKQREQLLERGAVKIMEQWKAKYYGAVRIDLF